MCFKFKLVFYSFVLSAFLFSGVAFAAQATADVKKPAEQRVKGDKAQGTQSEKSLISQRVTTLRQVRGVFLELAASPLPPGQSVAELGEATRYMNWLKTWATRLDRLAAEGEIQDMQMSFNMQYLMLQNKISHENRQFSMVSNIMKNKHDTAKNAINNIR